MATLLLLAAVFIAFGVFADQALPSEGAAAPAGANVELSSAWLQTQTVFNPGRP